MHKQRPAQPSGYAGPTYLRRSGFQKTWASEREASL